MKLPPIGGPQNEYRSTSEAAFAGGDQSEVIIIHPDH